MSALTVAIEKQICWASVRMDVIAETFWAKVNRGADDECWLWKGNVGQRGYGQMWQKRITGKRHMAAHRIAYELTVGKIPDGLVLDHLCRNPRCVNPAHLEPVTNKENILRGESVSAKNARKTHCPYGHPYSGDNVRYRRDGGRRCLTCQRNRKR